MSCDTSPSAPCLLLATSDSVRPLAILRGAGVAYPVALQSSAAVFATGRTLASFALHPRPPFCGSGAAGLLVDSSSIFKQNLQLTLSPMFSPSETVRIRPHRVVVRVPPKGPFLITDL